MSKIINNFLHPQVIAATITALGAVIVALIALLNKEFITNIFSDESDIEYICGDSNSIDRVPTTFIKTADRDEIPMILWDDDSFGDRWDPFTRCQEVTRRLNSFQENNTLKYITTGVLNNYPILCVNTLTSRKCVEQDLLITLKKDENPSEVLRDIFAFRDFIKETPILRGEEQDPGAYVSIEEYIRDAPRSKEKERRF